MSTAEVVERPQQARPVSLVVEMASRFGVEPNKLVTTLKATAFKTEKPVTDEQLMALLIVAREYNLNPFTRELFAFLDSKTGGIVPVVSVDGWARIVNEHAQCDGFTEAMADDGSWAECTHFRKDRTHHLTHREWLHECKRNTPPWNQSPKRMLGHRAFIQTARKTYGFAGIYDEDEGQRIINLGDAPEVPPPVSSAARLGAVVNKPPAEAAPSAGPIDSGTQASLVDDVPPVMFAADEIIGDIRAATHVEAAKLIADRARDLPEPERQRVHEAFRAKWVPQPPAAE